MCALLWFPAGELLHSVHFGALLRVLYDCGDVRGNDCSDLVVPCLFSLLYMLVVIVVVVVFEECVPSLVRREFRLGFLETCPG